MTLSHNTSCALDVRLKGGVIILGYAHEMLGLKQFVIC